jgi:hypothetical protein
MLGMGAGAPAADPRAEPARLTVDSSLTVSGWPAGQSAGSPDALIGRLTSKTSAQVRQRNS